MEDRCAFLEEEIPRIEASIAHTEEQLGVYVSAAETQRLTTLAEELRAQLTALTAEWEELMLQLEAHDSHLNARPRTFRVKYHRCSMTANAEKSRCTWAESDPLLRDYHDTEWGVPVRDSRTLWELLMLEGFQAGLAWIIVLRKRDAFRKAFKGFDPAKVARFREADIDRLLQNPGIIRSRAKIEATIQAARIYLEMQKAGEDFPSFLWGIVGGKPIRNEGPVPAQTPLAVEMSKQLKKRGFKFVGPVIVYAFMQAAGMVNDHSLTCFRRKRQQINGAESANVPLMSSLFRSCIIKRRWLFCGTPKAGRSGWPNSRPRPAT